MRRLVTGKRLADGVAAVHTAWGVGAFASFPAMILWPGVQTYVFWPLVAMVTSWFIWGDCPLTRFERWLRSKWDPDGLFGEEGFVGSRFRKLTGIRLTRKMSTGIVYGYTVLLFLVMWML